MVKQHQSVDGGADHGDIPVSGRLRKRKRRVCLSRAQALRMLSQKQAEADPGAGEPSSCSSKGNEAEAAGAGLQQPSGSGAVTPGGFINGEGSQEFLSTGRTGRRNAMPDILGQHADTGTADLPERLEALTTDPSGARSPAEPGPSQQQHAG